MPDGPHRGTTPGLRPGAGRPARGAGLYARRADGAQISTQGANGAPACVTCHGAKGEGNPSAGFPRLAGLGAKYLTEQLDAMADGGRVSPIMKATAQALDPAQRQAPLTTPPCPRLWIRTSSPRPRWAAPRGRHWRLAGHPRRLGQECPRLQPMPWSRRHRRRRQLPRAGGPVGCLHFRAVARLAPGPAPARPAGPDARRGHPPDRRRDRCRVGLLRRPAPGRRATGRASRRTGAKQ